MSLEGLVRDLLALNTQNSSNCLDAMCGSGDGFINVRNAQYFKSLPSTLRDAKAAMLMIKQSCCFLVMFSSFLD